MVFKRGDQGEGCEDSYSIVFGGFLLWVCILSLFWMFSLAMYQVIRYLTWL